MFEPSLVHGSITTLSPFRYWCQKVLPLVYDNSLSYYELLCKVVEYLNETMENVNTIGENTNALYNSYLELVEYVNNYLTDENLQPLIDNKLDEMAESGVLQTLLFDFTPYINVTKPYNNIEPMSPLKADNSESLRKFLELCNQNKKMLYIPNGEYKFTNSVSFDGCHGFKIFGGGNTTLLFDDSLPYGLYCGNGITISSTGMEFENLTIKSNNIGMLIINGNTINLNKLTFTGGDNDLYLTNCVNIYIKNCAFNVTKNCTSKLRISDYNSELVFRENIDGYYFNDNIFIDELRMWGYEQNGVINKCEVAILDSGSKSGYGNRTITNFVVGVFYKVFYATKNSNCVTVDTGQIEDIDCCFIYPNDGEGTIPFTNIDSSLFVGGYGGLYTIKNVSFAGNADSVFLMGGNFDSAVVDNIFMQRDNLLVKSYKQPTGNIIVKNYTPNNAKMFDSVGAIVYDKITSNGPGLYNFECNKSSYIFNGYEKFGIVFKKPFSGFIELTTLFNGNTGVKSTVKKINIPVSWSGGVLQVKPTVNYNDELDAYYQWTEEPSVSYAIENKNLYLVFNCLADSQIAIIAKLDVYCATLVSQFITKADIEFGLPNGETTLIQ